MKIGIDTKGNIYSNAGEAGRRKDVILQSVGATPLEVGQIVQRYNADLDELAWEIYQNLNQKGASLGSASVPIIKKTLEKALDI